MVPIKLSVDLPKYAYSGNEVKKNEAIVAQKEKVSMYQLMELAGQSSFSLANKLWPKARSILIVCGRGNNAGDGFVMARIALQRGMHVYLHILTALDDYTGDARKACEKFMQAGGCTVKFNDIDLAKVDYIVDAMLGTGLIGDVRENYALVCKLINQLPQPVLSLDIPTGLDADTGQVHGCVIDADITICFIAVKQGMLTGYAKNHCGEIYLAKINIGKQFNHFVRSKSLINGPHFLNSLTARKPCAHKGDIGFVVHVAGNDGYPGAARLSCEAALRSGAGLVGLICHPVNHMAVCATRPEIMLLNEQSILSGNLGRVAQANIVVLGPGLGRDQWAQKLFRATINLDKPIIIDADGLNLLSQQPTYKEDWVLTPHVKEAARLLKCQVSDIERNRFEAVRDIANTYGGICVLKGAGTLISNGDKVVINLTGNSGMASGGMGDVLSGIIASLSLQTDDLFMAACHAVYLHGKAGDLASQEGKVGLLASDLFPYIRTLVN